MTMLQEIEIPSPPSVALELIRLCSMVDADPDEILKLISTDAALSARLLRIANSAKFGQRKEVTNLRRASVILGSNYLKVVALGFHVTQLAGPECDYPIDLRLVWEGNLLRACLARQLALHSRRMHATCLEEAFLVGLLQDMMVPTLSKKIGPDYEEMLGRGGLSTDQTTLDMEANSTGSDHVELLAQACEAWSFPLELSVPLTKHHQAAPESDPVDRTVALWQLACWVASIPFNDDQRTAPVAEPLRSFASRVFGLDVLRLAQVFYNAIEEYESLHGVFDNVLPPKTDAAALMLRAQEVILDLNQPEEPDCD